MTVQAFFTQWNGKGCDFDNSYGFQCMDIVEQYNKDVIGAPRIGGNAIDVPQNYPKDFYDFIQNTPLNFPVEGDIVCWNTTIGSFGHVGIANNGTVNSFQSFDQNYPIGSVCHFQEHTYNGVTGWLHPKSQSPMVTISQAELDKIRLDRDNNWNLYQDTLKQLQACQNSLQGATEISTQPVLIDKILAFLQSLRGGGK